MKFTPLSLPGAFLIDLEKNEDNRGFFARFYCDKEFSEIGLNTRWCQMNNSVTAEQATLRGLHFQKSPNAEVKLVRCLNGSIWDVIVDIRNESPSFGKWCAYELSASNRSMMYVPEGFAHGFISMTANVEILYMVSAPYSPASEETLFWNDPNVGINWPIHPRILSEKDRNGLSLSRITKY